MPEFTYTGSDERYYPSLSFLAEPGETVTLDADPGDGRFALAGPVPAPKPVVAPMTDPAPTDDTPEVGN